MTVDPLDVLIRTYLQPVMQASGFRRRSRAFVRVLDSGDQAALFITRGLRLGDGYFRFWVTPRLGPRPFVDWMTSNRSPGAKPLPLDLVMMGMPPLPPPVEFYGGSVPLEAPGVTTATVAVWKASFYSEDEFARCGAALAAAVASHVLPHLDHLQVRQNLLRQVLSPEPGQYLVYGPRLELTQVILLIDDAPPAEVDTLIRGLESNPDNREFVQWSRARLALRQAGQTESESHVERTDDSPQAPDLGAQSQNGSA